MKRIVDKSGIIIEGLFRQDGCIVVDDVDLLNKYKTQSAIYKEKDKRIMELEQKVDILFAMLNNQKE